MSFLLCPPCETSHPGPAPTCTHTQTHYTGASGDQGWAGVAGGYKGMTWGGVLNVAGGGDE